jgi:uncharacterized repeat protein (TIGR01451 family)
MRVAASLGALALTVSALGGGTLLAAVPAQAAPGTPGTPQANTTVFTEGFENGPGTSPQLLTAYTGVGGQRYTADSGWLTGCNGQVVNFNIPPTTLGNCSTEANSARLRQLAYALGAHTGSATPATNDVVGAYTENNPGANAVEFQTVANIPLASASGRFLTFSVDTAAQNCAVSAPQYQFSFLNQAGVATNVGGIVNACTSTKTVPVPASGPLVASNINVGTYTSNGSVLFTGSTLGIRMTNANGSGVGNDAAFDNIRILDVTPQLDKSFSPTAVTTGGVSTLTFTVTNTAELAAKNGWSFTDALPAGLTLASPTAAATTCPAGSVTGAAGATSVAVTGNLTAGMASCTVTVNVTSSTAGSYTNGPGNVTPNGLNPPGSTTVTFSNPLISIVKNAGTPVDVNGNGLTDAGDTIQYTFDVSNPGDVPLTNVAVSDPKVGAVTCPQTILAAGATETCSATTVYTITAADVTAGAVDNIATATGTTPAGGTITTTPSTTSTPTTASAPGISIVKSASGPATYTVGEVVTYNFVVTNTGNVPLNTVSINETAFSGSGGSPVVNCPATTLAVGAQMVCTAPYTLTTDDVNDGSVTNTATATGIPTGSTTPITSTPSTVTIPITPAPGLTVLKSASPTVVALAGQTVDYSFRVTNTGNVTLTGVTIDETAFTGSGTVSAIVCPVTTLVAGQVATCTASYTVTQADVDAGGTVSNTATALGTPPTGTPVTSTPSTAVVTPTQSPALTVVKTADATVAEVGQVVTYSFLVTNTGNLTITDPEVAEGAFTGSGAISAIVCPSSTDLAPGDDVTCTATYTVTQADVDSGAISNAATVTGTTPGGGTTDPSDPSTAIVPTDPAPALTVVKTADRQTISAVGQVVTYSFRVTNTGTATIINPTVAEGAFTGSGTLSPLVCAPGTTPLAPAASFVCTATYTVVAADLEAGNLANTATVSGTTPGGGPVVSTPSTATVTNVFAPVVPSPPVPAAIAGVLAYTGSDGVMPAVGVALLLVLLGGVLMVVRRRKHNSQHDAA